MNSIPTRNKIFKLQSNSPEQSESRPAYQAITVSNVVVGEGDTNIATLDLKLGGLLIHHVKVRRGRKGSVYINLPSIRIDGKWIEAIEILSPSLENFVRQTILRAVAEVTR